jgi:hypothetical protein
MRVIPVVVAMVALVALALLSVPALNPVAPGVLVLADQMETRVRLEPLEAREAHLLAYVKLFPEVLLEMAGLGEMVGHKAVVVALETQCTMTVLIRTKILTLVETPVLAVAG